MGAGLRAAAGSRVGRAGTARARTQAGAGAAGPPRGGEPPASPQDTGFVRRPKWERGRDFPPTAVDWVAEGGPLGCRSARGPRVPVWCGSGRDAQPSELGRMRQARDSHFPGVGWVWGYARGSVSPPAGTVPELEVCLGLWIWQDASGLEPLGTPAPFSSHPTPLRNGLSLGSVRG